VPALAGAQPASPQQPVTHEVLWLMPRVGAPAVSPDGKWAVFPVTEPAYDEKKEVSDVWIVAAWGSSVSPAEIVRVDPATRKQTGLTTFAAAKAAALDWQPPQEFTFTNAKGRTVHSFVVLPAGFDPAREYPLLVLIHGGHANMWRDQISLRWNYHLLASPGYVVLLTDYRELMMGMPFWEDPRAWLDQSPIAYARDFKTPMLLSVGERDFQVPLNNTLEMYAALQRMRVPARLLVWPEENHCILKGEDSVVFYREVRDWLARWLGATLTARPERTSPPSSGRGRRPRSLPPAPSPSAALPVPGRPRRGRASSRPPRTTPATR
jgi:acetyl esterase/lipase